MGPLVSERSIIICCGSGGAGKTTTSAAVALAGAVAGRKACVVTIDPARRLADALGLAELSNEPRRIEGPWPGEMSAVMLDAKRTFDDLVGRYSADEEQADRILNNRLYRNLTSALAGTQEYMAAEKLYELHATGDFDLVVVDTPPTRNALDFLDAPGRLTRFLENRVFRLLLMPTRASLKALTMATQALLRTISKVAGSEIVEDAVAFFRAFEGMEEGFRERARRVEELLADPGTAFVLVAAPRRDSVDEAGYFADRLAEAHQPVSALVVNRLHPDFRLGAGAGVGVASGSPDGEGAGEASGSRSDGQPAGEAFGSGPVRDGAAEASGSGPDRQPAGEAFGSQPDSEGAAEASASRLDGAGAGDASGSGSKREGAGEASASGPDGQAAGETSGSRSKGEGGGARSATPLRAGQDRAGGASPAGDQVSHEIGRDEAAEALAGMRQNLADLQLLADRERDYLAVLESRIEGAVVKVPYLRRDVHDLEGLGLVAAYLTGQVLSERA
jgi:anion-transporting  ArsA/GET3 family ATPase